MDSKEPKEKHVFCKYIYKHQLSNLPYNIPELNPLYLTVIIECLRGSIPSITPRESMTKIIERFLKNIGSWACTTKIFIILHRCL